MPRKPRTEFEVKSHPSGIYYLYYPKTFANKVGQSRESTGCRDEAAAKRFLRDFLDGLDAPPPEEERTVAEAIQLYLNAKREAMESLHAQDHVKRAQALKSIRSLEYALVEPLALMGHLHMRHAGKSSGDAYIDKRRRMPSKNIKRDAGGKEIRRYVQDGTIRKELAVTTAALNYAAEAWNVFVKPFELPEAGESDGVLIPNEHLSEFMVHMREHKMHLYVFCMLMLYTLARPGAIFALTWDRVNFEQRYINYNEPGRKKNGKKRVNAAMTQALLDCLKEAYHRRDRSCDNVVQWKGKSITTVRRSFGSTMKTLGYSYVPYDMKHTAITKAVQAGISWTKISLASGVSESTLKKHYYKYSPDYTQSLDPLEAAYGSFEKCT